MSPPWKNNKNLTVINVLGGPSVGKSTNAADLFSRMKRKRMKVELIHEVAKDFTWEDWDQILTEQDYVFAHQHRLQRRLVGRDIEYVVIDSSLLLGLFYIPEDYPKSFAPFIRDVYDSYSNINIVLERNPNIQYENEGRNQSEDEAKSIDLKVVKYLESEKIPYKKILAGDDAGSAMLEYIESLPSKYS